TEARPSRHLFGDAAAGQVGARRLSGRAPEVVGEVPGRNLAGAKESAPASDASARFRVVFEDDAGLIGELAQGGGEILPLHLHHEGDGVAAPVAAEAAEAPALRKDVKGRRALGVEGAQADVAAAHPAQLDVPPDEFHQVGAEENLLDLFPTAQQRLAAAPLEAIAVERRGARWKTQRAPSRGNRRPIRFTTPPCGAS